jgi:prepilin-type N-terminal cleavage/methylation domain-containing protein
MRKNESGFTLIELMIVIAIIAIIAAIAIPNLLAAKVASNETSAIATLRTMGSSQAQTAQTGKIDVDRDGAGEYGTFLEMSGGAGCRKNLISGTPNCSDFTSPGTVMNPTTLPAVFQSVDSNGFVTKAGYAFMVFLPDGQATAKWAYETNSTYPTSITPGLSAPVAIDLSETNWCAYAQPVAYSTSGNRRFYVNQGGDIRQSLNDTMKIAGTTTVINGNSAYAVDGITSQPVLGTKGLDGEVWRTTN